MAPIKKEHHNKSIKDFFKPFTIPKNRRPVTEIQDEIIVAAPKLSSPSSSLSSAPTDLSLRQPSATPTKREYRLDSPAKSGNVPSPARASPSKTARQRSPLKSEAMASDGLIHISPSSAERRELKAVEIPSPSLRVRMTSLEQYDGAADKATTSFSSMSSLSSIPQSTTSSSRRVIKGGMHAVTNSDSGSEDSEEELADLSTLFQPNKRRKLTPPPGADADHAISIPSTAKTAARQSTRLSDKSARSSRAATPRLPPSPPRTVYKHSLMNMIRQREKIENSEAKIYEMEVAFEEARRRREVDVQRDRDLQGGLKAAMADDSDEGERMMLAMQRTEALEEEEKVYYFQGVKSDSFGKSFPDLQPNCLPLPGRKLLSNEPTRKEAFLSGFVASLVRGSASVDEGLRRWTAGQLLIEPREDLCEAYIGILQACAALDGSSIWKGLRLSHFYQTVDLAPVEMYDDLPRSVLFPKTDVPPRSLHRVLEAITCHNPKQNPTNMSLTLRDLSFANIDECVRSDAALQEQISRCFENVLESISEKDLKSVYRGFWEHFTMETFVTLQVKCRLITALPALTQRSHQFRRSLALHIMCNRTNRAEYLDDINSPIWWNAILQPLKTARAYAINESTDYNLLNALTSVLDIAVDSGFDVDNHTTDNPASKLDSKQTEQAFNAQIDALASQLQLIASRIRDAGTSHLRRTEAKSALERLIVRLEYSVRTRPKPQKSVFGGAVNEQRAFLSGFLKQMDAGAQSTEDDRVSILPVDTLSGRQSSGDESADSGAQDERAASPDPLQT